MHVLQASFDGVKLRYFNFLDSLLGVGSLSKLPQNMASRVRKYEKRGFVITNTPQRRQELKADLVNRVQRNRVNRKRRRKS